MEQQLLTPGIELRLARDEAERDSIYRLRYAVYVEEMARPQKHADHQHKTIVDPLDRSGFTFGAWRDGALVGTVRLNLGSIDDLGGYERFYQMAAVPEHPQHTSIVTRLMVAPAERVRSLALDLAHACYRLGLDHAVRWCFIDCNRPVEPLFKRLGFIAHLPPAEHDEYGLVHRLRLDLHDLEHLNRTGSIFAATLRAWRQYHAANQSA